MAFLQVTLDFITILYGGYIGYPGEKFSLCLFGGASSDTLHCLYPFFVLFCRSSESFSFYFRDGFAFKVTYLVSISH